MDVYTHCFLQNGFVVVFEKCYSLYPCRYNKCKSCYKHLMDIRNEIGQKQSHGKNAAMVKELQLLMSQLD